MLPQVPSTGPCVLMVAPQRQVSVIGCFVYSAAFWSVLERFGACWTREEARDCKRARDRAERQELSEEKSLSRCALQCHRIENITQSGLGLSDGLLSKGASGCRYLCMSLLSCLLRYQISHPSPTALSSFRWRWLHAATSSHTLRHTYRIHTVLFCAALRRPHSNKYTHPSIQYIHPASNAAAVTSQATAAGALAPTLTRLFVPPAPAIYVCTTPIHVPRGAVLLHQVPHRLGQKCPWR